MPDDDSSENEQPQATADTTVVALVVPDGPDPAAPEPTELETLRAHVAALQASLDAHYSAHAEIMGDEEETEGDEEEHDRSDDSGDADTERSGETTEGEETERPIRRGLGGFLFGPIRKR